MWKSLSATVATIFNFSVFGFAGIAAAIGALAVIIYNTLAGLNNGAAGWQRWVLSNHLTTAAASLWLAVIQYVSYFFPSTGPTASAISAGKTFLTGTTFAHGLNILAWIIDQFVSGQLLTDIIGFMLLWIPFCCLLRVAFHIVALLWPGSGS